MEREPGARGGTRAASAATVVAVGHSGGRAARTPVKATRPHTSADQLRQREEECLRRNAELEERTSLLVQEAQAFLSNERSSTPPPPAARGTSSAGDTSARRPQSSSGVRGSSSARSAGKQQRPSSRGSRPVTVGGTGSRSSTGKPLKATRPPSAPAKPSGAKTVHDLTTAIAAAKLVEQTDGDSAPSTVDMAGLILADDSEDAVVAPGAVTRLLKARVVVLQEELQAMAASHAAKDNKVKQLDGSVKQLNEEKSHLAKQLQNAKIQLDKQTHIADQARQSTANLEKQLSAVRKDYEASQTNSKQLVANQSALEVRLNRALEEVERLKSAMQQRGSQAKQSSEHNRQLVEQLQLQAKQHEKQKTDLIAIFRKQQKLIDVLKQQKMHIEAARVLEFSEKEFISLLDWGSSN